MSESGELYTTVNYIKHKVDALEKIPEFARLDLVGETADKGEHDDDDGRRQHHGSEHFAHSAREKGDGRAIDPRRHSAPARRYQRKQDGIDDLHLPLHASDRGKARLQDGDQNGEQHRADRKIGGKVDDIGHRALQKSVLDRVENATEQCHRQNDRKGGKHDLPLLPDERKHRPPQRGIVERKIPRDDARQHLLEVAPFVLRQGREVCLQFLGIQRLQKLLDLFLQLLNRRLFLRRERGSCDRLRRQRQTQKEQA